MYTVSDVLICGIEKKCDHVPIHQVHINSDFVNGMVNLRVYSNLPFQGVGLVLGNDLAGGHVFPRPIVVSKGNGSDANDFS